MTTFVFVHGAWGGSWGWTNFARLMRSAGHEVFTPSLTGQGERTHLGGPNVNLSTHILDVENTIKYEGLTDIALVGHSYGGMVVTGVADRVPEVIRQLIYVDAFLPQDGESCFDLGGAGGPERATIVDGWKVMPMARPATPEMEARAWRMSPQPIGTLEEKVHLSMPLEQRDVLAHLHQGSRRQPERRQPHRRFLGRIGAHQERPPLALLRAALRPWRAQRAAERAQGNPRRGHGRRRRRVELRI